MQLDYTQNNVKQEVMSVTKCQSNREHCESFHMLLCSHYVVFSVQADPEDGVSYASISYTKKTSKARVSCLTGSSGDVTE